MVFYNFCQITNRKISSLPIVRFCFRSPYSEPLFFVTGIRPGSGHTMGSGRPVEMSIRMLELRPEAFHPLSSRSATTPLSPG